MQRYAGFVTTTTAVLAVLGTVVHVPQIASAATARDAGSATESDHPLVSNAGHAAELARIVAPRGEALVRGKSVPIAIRLRPQASAFGAWLGARDVTARFRVRGQRRVAVIPRALLRRGRNQLVVRTRDRQGGRDIDRVVLVPARRATSLVRLVAPGKGTAPVRVAGVLRTHLRFQRGPHRFRVRLNGRLVSDRLRGGLIRRGHLAADDGLRFGRNRLEIVASHGDGAWDVARRTVVVSRARPLAAAGRDRRPIAGTRIRLDGRRSRATRSGARLAYSWRVINRARNAGVRLIGARSARPVVITARPGRYKVALTVHERSARRGGAVTSRRATDVIEVTAVPDLPPMGAWLDVGDVRTADRVGIAVGDRFYEFTDNQSAHVLVLDRETLQPALGLLRLDSRAGYRSQYARAIVNAYQTGRKLIWLAHGPRGCCPGGDPLPNNGFSEIIYVRTDGRASARIVNDGLMLRDPNDARLLNEPGEITGWLQQDNNDLFTLIRPPYLSFDSSGDSGPGRNVMTVNDRSYSSELPQGQSGFQLLALERTNLDPLGGFPKVYAVNTGNGGQDGQNQQAMANDLKGALDRGAFVMVQSIGQPKPTTPAWASIASQVERIGASGHAFNTLDGSTAPGTPSPLSYAVAGCTVCERAAESSYPLTRAKGAGSVSGVLAWDERSQWDLRLRDAGVAGGGDIDYRMTQIAYQSPVPWPAGAAPGEQHALGYVHKKLNLPVPDPNRPDKTATYCYQRADVRAAYCNASIEWGADELPTLAGISWANDCGCSQDELNTVKGQLAKEFPYVDKVNTLFARIESIMATALTAKLWDVKTIGDDVAAAVQNQPSGQQHSALVEYLAAVLEVVTEVADIAEVHSVSMLGGVTSSVLSLAGDTTSDAGGSPLVEFTVAADQLGQQMTNAFVANAQQRGHIHNLIVTDWRKLSTVAPLVDGEWGDNPKYTPKLYNVLRLGSARWAWQHLLPGAYQAYVFYPPKPGYRLNDLWCEFEGASSGHPFENESNWASWTPIDHFDGNMSGRYSYWLALGSGDFRSRHFKIPPGNMVEQIFRGPVDLNNLNVLSPGLQKPWLFGQAQWKSVTDVRPDSTRSNDGVWTPKACGWPL